MIKNGYLLEAGESRLAALELRKAAAHPKRPTIWAPGHARSTLATTAERLNALFASARAWRVFRAVAVHIGARAMLTKGIEIRPDF